jgi:DNA-binding GntR family transcriptional regulator
MGAILGAEYLVQNSTYAFLKEAIITLRFRPGQRLRSAEIAQMVKASRTPVREALSRLEQEGLVRRDGGWGYVVNEVSVEDVLEIWAVRESLEVQAATEALQRMRPGDLDELSSLNARAEALYTEHRFVEFLDQNRSFHIALARMSGNNLLQQMLGMIHDRVRMVGNLLVRLHEPRAHELLLENRKIMAALRAGDRQAVVDAIHSHLQLGREHVSRLLHAGEIHVEKPHQPTPGSTG